MSDKIMLCRCEDVTLDDIEEALGKGHDDIESVKRYTGFGTGFCQGKQCVALCARVIVERTGSVVDAPFTARPPFHPVPLAHLAAMGRDQDDEDAADDAEDEKEPA